MQNQVKNYTIAEFKLNIITFLRELKLKTDNKDFLDHLNKYIDGIPYVAPELFARYYNNMIDNLMKNFITADLKDWFSNKLTDYVANTDWNF